jgi:hypothetical protein
MRMKTTLLFVAAFVVALAGCDLEELGSSNAYKEDFHFAYDFQPGGTLSVETMNGEIDVRSWNENRIDIAGTKSAATEELLKQVTIDIVRSGNSVRIRTIRPSDRRGNLGARYVIKVPAKTELERLVTSNGAVHVEGIDGRARINTSNAGVRAFRLHGDLDATTSNGGVEVMDLTGGAVIRTSNGGVKIDSVRGYLEAVTTNGPITARLENSDASRPVKLESSNGPITLEVDQPKTADIHASTSNAPITLKLPAAASAKVQASTSNGGIQTDFDVAAKGTMSKNRLEGTIGSGGPLLMLSTSNGPIRIQKM